MDDQDAYVINHRITESVSFYFTSTHYRRGEEDEEGLAIVKGHDYSGRPSVHQRQIKVGGGVTVSFHPPPHLTNAHPFSFPTTQNPFHVSHPVTM